MEKKKVTCKDLEGLRQLFPENSRERVLSAEEPGMGMPAPANASFPGGYYGGDGYGSSGETYGYYGEDGYIIDGGELPGVVIYGYYGGKDKDEEKEEDDEGGTSNPGTDIPFFPGGGGGGEDIGDGYPEIPDKSGEGYPGYPYDPYDPYYMEYGNAYGYLYGEDSGSSGSSSDPLTDGVDVTNSKHFTFNTDANPAFHKQLVKILRSNSVLKSLLSYFDNGNVHMTFNITDK